MNTRSRTFVLGFLVAGFGLTLAGCSGAPRTIACQCPIRLQPALFATTTADQILGFAIAPSGTLTSLPAVNGPANSQSIAGTGNGIYFADSTNNQVVGESLDMSSGILTPAVGSPFSLGTGTGGPTSLLVDNNYPIFYATEPNGTIVGYSAPGLGTLTTPLPGSPYAAGVSPAQMALDLSNISAPFLYASDPGDTNGGILAFSVASDSSLSPISGSPFPTAAGAGPSFLLQAIDASENQFLFASLSNVGQVAAFRIDPSTGALTPVAGSPFTVGNGPGTLFYGSVTSELFVMNTVDHTVAAFNVSSNGSLTPLGSPVPVGTASGGMAMYSSGNGSVLFTADAAASAIETVNIDSSSGAISAGSILATPLPPVQLIQPSPFE